MVTIPSRGPYWSGATGYIGHSSNSAVHGGGGAGWSGATGFYIVSSNYINFSSNTQSLYYPSSLGAGISGSYLLLDGSNANQNIEIGYNISAQSISSSKLSNGSQIDLSIGGTNQLNLTDGALVPTTDDDIDLGTPASQFKNAYIDGELYSDVSYLGLAFADTYYIQGDINTYIYQVNTDEMEFMAGGVDFIFLDEGTNDRIYINQNQVNIDFVVYGNNKTLIWADGGTDLVGINTETPQYQLEVNGSISAQVYSGGKHNWNSTNWHNSSLIWDSSLQKWKAMASGGTGGSTTLDALTDTNLSTPRSGQTLIYKQNDSKWENELPPITYSQSNIQISANQNINLARFECPAGKKAYIWQANCCGSGGAAISGMWIEMLAGTSTSLTGADSIFKTSSQVMQQGYPLGVTNAADHVEVRFMYSSHSTGLVGNNYQYGNAVMQVSIME